ncbi:MAG: HNH endonuclease [Sulfuricaulis sp.]|uniref:HNH endonuclease n=1 Tax=Sulfuricaulis sp. TaxID=2003553 RepID=UPI0025D5803A|nr:HNH endonuclease [Sulfuricaulis sp.]MCR4347895.1 HNH endonuclease [Sulfuricaulis sp.]
MDLIIKYEDSEGNVTERRISEIVPEGPSTISAFCHLRQERRTFVVRRILSAVYPDTDKKVEDLNKCFSLPLADNKTEISSRIEQPVISIPGHSNEAYKGQRNKEKRDLFKRFGYPVVANLYKNKLFALFEYQCFKCGSNDFLDIDHHIPMVLGGHLVPGYLVALCKKCNNKKLDLHPEDFYTPEELSRLEPILKKQTELFEFEFDWKRWKEDRKGYLLSLGIDPNLVNEVLNNPNHRYYIEPPSQMPSVTISIKISEE